MIDSVPMILQVVQFVLLPLVGYATHQLHSIRQEIRTLNGKLVDVQIQNAKNSARLDALWGDREKQ